MPDVRARAGGPIPVMERDLAQSFDQESRADFPRGPDGLVRYPHLAVSGGGANGAFGAGFLNGWTATGSRPVFKIVTGVSTGALIAPFAFLGSQYDDALREFYTTTATRDIFALGTLLLQLLQGEALADTAPLAALIARHVDEEFLGKITDAHARGRRLYMASVDLDSQQFVVWNMALDRRKRPSGGVGALSQGDARVRVHPGRLSARVLRGRGRRAALRRDARRRCRGIQRLRERRGVSVSRTFTRAADAVRRGKTSF